MPTRAERLQAAAKNFIHGFADACYYRQPCANPQCALHYTIFITPPRLPTGSARAKDSSTSRKIILPLAASLLFLALGVLLIPLAGIQNDEALFSHPIFSNGINYLGVRTMIIPYLGALKTVFYIPIWAIFGVDVWTLRLPVVLAGGITVFFFYLLTEMAASRKAAFLGALLLASDPIVIMTTTFDWGPVALEHLFLVTGSYALCRFGRNPHSESRKWLAGGFFCYGLALWNKATFSWALAGLAIACVTALWPFLRRGWSSRNAVVAGAAFLIGAFPLVWYNVRYQGITFWWKANLAPAEAPGKWPQVKAALQGSSVFGYIAAGEEHGPPKAAEATTAKVSAWLSERLGLRRESGFYYAAGGLLLLFPLWRRSRAAWFSLVFCAVAWLTMAITHGGGEFAHHVVLLWPFPILFVACALDEISRRISRWILPAVGVTLVVLNLSVVNQYLYQLHRYGSHGTFTDAIFPLSSSLGEEANSRIYVTDWGISNTLSMLHEGRLDVEFLGELLQPEPPTLEQMEIVGKALRNPSGVFVGHLRGQEIFPNVGAHLDALAEQAGMRLEVVQTISNSNGLPMFEISRAVPSP